MTISEFHTAILVQLDKTAGLELPHFEPEEREYWLNQGVNRFCKQRYSGVNPKLTGFEQTQKRIDDLRTLIRETKLTLSAPTSNVNKPNSKTASISGLTNYWFTLGEEVLIAYVSLSNALTTVASGSLTVGSVFYVVSGAPTNNLNVYAAGDFFLSEHLNYTGTAVIVAADTKRVGITEITSNNYNKSLSDPYSEHILHYEDANPLRLFYNDEIEYIHDGTYDIFYAYVRYFKQPQILDSLTDIATGSIEEGVTYEVYGTTADTVTYNLIVYSVGEKFVGVNGVTTYAESTPAATEVVVTIDLPEHTHEELVQITKDLMLENIEQPRHQTSSRLVSEME